MTKYYILAIGTNHDDPEALGDGAAQLFSEAGFVLTVLRGVKLETAREFEKEDQLLGNGQFILWGKGSGLELEFPAQMVMHAEARWRELTLGGHK